MATTGGLRAAPATCPRRRCRGGILATLLAFAALCSSNGCGLREPTPASAASLPDPFRIRITAADFQWITRYPGADGRLDTRDDVVALRDVHLPANLRTEIELTSRDYLYTFSIPRLKVKEMAVPDLIMGVAISAGPPAVFDLRGDQMCGFSHEDLLVKVVVMDPGEFLDWQQEVRKRGR